MDMIIGKYRVRIEKTGLVLTHEAGISVDLTLKEATELMTCIKVYHKAIKAAQHDTEPSLSKTVVGEKPSDTAFDSNVGIRLTSPEIREEK